MVNTDTDVRQDYLKHFVSTISGIDVSMCLKRAFNANYRALKKEAKFS